MSDFIRYVLFEFKNSLLLVILAGLLAAVTIGIVYFLFNKKYKGERKFPWGKIIMYLLLAGYLLVVSYVTLMRGAGSFRQEWNLHIFRAWREAWNNFSVKNWANVLLNVAMFVPLGVLLPLLWKKCRKWYITIPICLAASLAIELIQLAVGRGICDVDDLFANTLGAVIGFCGVMAILALMREKGKRLRPCLLYCAVCLLPVLAIGSIFIIYEAKEYGNLANAPAYSNNTGGVEWVLDCRLPTVSEKTAVYRTQALSTADCDEFAEDLAETAGLSVDLTSYYQYGAYYNLRPRGILSVNYYDGAYRFSPGLSMDEETEWIETDRESLEKALSIYPVIIPEAAEFCYEGEGWHSFTVLRHIDGAIMYDGTLRVRYAGDGTVGEIQNNLLSYTYYEDVDIISPEMAYQRLCAGKFYDGGYFEHISPKEVLVRECVPDYQVDTKGFYQPVYIFYLEATDGSYGYNVMIPAMK